MPIHLRQVCLVAEKLEPCRRDIEAVFRTPVCHRDPEVATFGLENALFALGSQFLEVVAPTQPGTAAGRFLERKGGDGGYMVICQAPTLEEQAQLRARAADNQVRVAYESDRGTWNIMQLHPRDMEAAFLEVDWDQQADMTGNWQPAGGLAWTGMGRNESVRGIVGLELSGNDPQRLAQHWSRVLGEPVQVHNGLPAIELANAVLRFSKGDTASGQGLTGVDVNVADPCDILARAKASGLPTGPDGFRLCGVTFNCMPA
ncbi:VOC family protein [Marinobacter lacisalsi]|uniref:VOC family protein n=1 Tax=Marinobacter lacisalsi TaxID=475979 RepID=A0ABV8QKS6_9GAMM